MATAKLNQAEIFQDEGLIAESISIGVTSERALEFLNQPKSPSSIEVNYKYSTSELYKYMRSGVVLIVGQ